MRESSSGILKLMDFADLQRHWDAFGRADPFWAILTDPTRRGNRWDPAEFFETGRHEIAVAFQHASRFAVPASRRRGLDFGCGAGRLTQALAEQVDEAIGVDVAPSMIDLARRHANPGARCRYEVNGRPDLSLFPEAAFDVIYTSRVLQHMEARYAEAYLREFVRVLAPGGYLSFDLPSAHGFFPADAGPPSRSMAAYRAAVHFEESPPVVAPGEVVRVVVSAINIGTHHWQSGEINIGNHWARPDGSLVVRDDARARLLLPWSPGAQQRAELAVTAPAEPGVYRLQCDLVEEGVTWFADAGSPMAESTVTVGSGTAARDPAPIPAETVEEPAMEMHAVARERVEQLLAGAGARLLDVRRVSHCGSTWLAFRYDCTR